MNESISRRSFSNIHLGPSHLHPALPGRSHCCSPLPNSRPVVVAVPLHALRLDPIGDTSRTSGVNNSKKQLLRACYPTGAGDRACVSECMLVHGKPGATADFGLRSPTRTLSGSNCHKLLKPKKRKSIRGRTGQSVKRLPRSRARAIGQSRACHWACIAMWTLWDDHSSSLFHSHSNVAMHTRILASIARTW